ncbi:hypothetical protein LXL04_031762 [Taraxacum kok-saghyz]
MAIDFNRAQFSISKLVQTRTNYENENARTNCFRNISKGIIDTTGPPPAPTGPPPAPTTGPPSDYRRTTVGAPLAPIGTSDHRRTTATTGPPSDHRRTTIGPPPDHRWTTVGPPPDHRRCTTCTHRHIGPLSDHRRTTAEPPPDHRRCTTCTHRHIGPLPNHRRTIVGLPPIADALPGLHLLPNFSVAVDMLQEKLEQRFDSLEPRPSCMISDKYMLWTADTENRVYTSSVRIQGARHMDLMHQLQQMKIMIADSVKNHSTAIGSEN